MLSAKEKLQLFTRKNVMLELSDVDGGDQSRGQAVAYL